MVSDEKVLEEARDLASKGRLGLRLLALKNSGRSDLVELIEADAVVRKYNKMRKDAKKKRVVRSRSTVLGEESKSFGVVTSFHKDQAKKAKNAIKRKNRR